MSFFIDNDNNLIQSAPGNNSNWTIDPQTGYLIVLGTGGIQIPSGTTAQEPSVTTAVLRYNTSLGLFEGYNINASAWKQFQSHFNIVDSLGALATNGIVVNNAGTISAVTITAGTGVSVTNGSGTAGNPTISNTGVLSFSGDGTIISNSSSTGAVTATLANAGPGTLLGNNGSTSAAPSYTSAPVLGKNATTAGTLGLANGGTSGATITLQNLGATTAYNFNLPTSAGTSGQPLLSGGGSSTSMTFGTLGVGAGGTGLTATPANGQLLIGNASGFTLATLTAGTAIGITNAAGSITVNNTGVTSITGTTNQITASASTGAVTLSLPATLSVGAVTATSLTDSGLTANSFLYSGTAGLLTTTTAPTNGQLLIGSTGNAPVAAALTAGTAIGITNAAGSITINNNGVTSNVAGTGISVSGATGAVTITNTGVTSIAGTAGDITASASTGAVTLDLATITQSTGSSFVKITLDTKGRVTGNTAVAQSDLTGLLGTYYLPTAGGTMSGAINMGSNQINNLGSPVAASDAATKSYVDTSIQGLSFKQTVAAASTAALTATYNNGASGVGATLTNAGAQAAFAVDGYTASVNDRILIKNQASAFQNGIYTVTTVGSGSTNWVLTRSLDANSPAELVGAYVFVDQGTTFADTSFAQVTPPTITIGTTSLIWTQFSGAGTYSAGTGLTLTGTTFSVTTNGITNSLFRQSAANSIVGNPTGSTANVTDITLGSTLTFVAGALQTLALTGDVTASANSFATTVAKIQGTTVSGTTGSGNVVFSTSPSLTTPAIGAATGSSLTLSGLTANSFLYSGTAGLLTTTSAPTNGQLLIGSTGNAPVAATLTAGTAIGITNAAGSITVNNTGVTSNVAGTGISVSGATGAVTITNTGVTSAVAGTGISVSGATGAVTFSNTGVTSITGTANQITASASTGGVTLSLPASVSTTNLTLSGLTANSFLYSGTAGLLTTTAAPTNGQILIGSTGAAPVAATLTAGTNISITNTPGAISIAATGLQTALQLYKENPSSPNALTATGTNAVAIGNGASATQTNATAIGNGATTEWVSEHTMGGSYYSTAGDSKLSFAVATCQTTNNTATEIGFNTSSGAPSSYIVPAINSSYFFEVIVTAHRTDVTGSRFCEKFEFLFDKGATSATAVIVGSPLSTVIARDPGLGWSVAISADATNGRPAIKVTGATGQTIRWVAQIRALKVT